MYTPTDADPSGFDLGLQKYEFEQRPKRDFVYQEPRQLLLRNYISKPTGYDNLLLFHQTGTGKTCTSITIAEGFKEYLSARGRKVIVLVKNKNIERNFKSGLMSECTLQEYKSDLDREDYDQTTINRDTQKKINKAYTFLTYGTFTNQVLGTKSLEPDNTTRRNIGNLEHLAEQFSNTVIIVDEVHNVTNNNVYVALKKVLSSAINYRLILLTATPIFDSVKEILEISNLLNANEPRFLFPVSSEKNNKFLRDSETVSNLGLIKSQIYELNDETTLNLAKALQGKVSYLAADPETFPRKIEMGVGLTDQAGSVKVVRCTMSKYQARVYQKALEMDTGKRDAGNTGSLYKNSNDALTFAFPDETFGQSGFINFFESTGVPKAKYENVMTSMLQRYSCKLYAILENLQEIGSHFIYSNFVNNGGTNLIKQVLIQNGYKAYKKGIEPGTKTFILFDDTVGIERREYERRVFNSPKNKDGDLIKIIIGSPILSEGITLKNVRNVHIVEPAWNLSRINQVIGRALRHKSHKDLRPTQRYTKIFRYVSVFKESDEPRTYTIDEEKYLLSEYKDRIAKGVERLLKEIAIDCSNNLDQRQFPQEDYSPDCDYTVCDYKCKYPILPELSSDDFTYNMFIDVFDKFDINFSRDLIERLFKKQPIWKIDDIVEVIQASEPVINVKTILETLLDLVRNGFLVLKSDFIFFNSLDTDVGSSLYAKTLDFRVSYNKYTLSEYLRNPGARYISDLPTTKNPTSTIRQPVTLTPEDLTFNQELPNRTKIFGTYRKRGTKTQIGVFDGKFRIIDLRKIQDVLDNRKAVSGMTVTSFNKRQLIEIIEYLNIPKKTLERIVGFPTSDFRLKDLDIVRASKIIEEYMKEKDYITK
jgi:superfamily II DNA or RNA helicase